jgi:Pyruvate/2-oxoacid:ferredoxin oxidoreductase delta subunit
MNDGWIYVLRSRFNPKRLNLCTSYRVCKVWCADGNVIRLARDEAIFDIILCYNLRIQLQICSAVCNLQSLEVSHELAVRWKTTA